MGTDTPVSSTSRKPPARNAPHDTHDAAGNPPSDNQAGPSKRKKFKRTRNGCLTCRSRKVLCPKDSFICSNCERLSLACRWPQEHRNADVLRAGTAGPQASTSYAHPPIHGDPLYPFPPASRPAVHGDPLYPFPPAAHPGMDGDPLYSATVSELPAPAFLPTAEVPPPQSPLPNPSDPTPPPAPPDTYTNGDWNNLFLDGLAWTAVPSDAPNAALPATSHFSPPTSVHPAPFFNATPPAPWLGQPVPHARVQLQPLPPAQTADPSAVPGSNTSSTTLDGGQWGHLSFAGKASGANGANDVLQSGPSADVMQSVPSTGVASGNWTPASGGPSSTASPTSLALASKTSPQPVTYMPMLTAPASRTLSPVQLRDEDAGLIAHFLEHISPWSKVKDQNVTNLYTSIFSKALFNAHLFEETLAWSALHMERWIANRKKEATARNRSASAAAASGFLSAITAADRVEDSDSPSNSDASSPEDAIFGPHIAVPGPVTATGAPSRDPHLLRTTYKALTSRTRMMIEISQLERVSVVDLERYIPQLHMACQYEIFRDEGPFELLHLLRAAAFLLRRAKARWYQLSSLVQRVAIIMAVFDVRSAVFAVGTGDYAHALVTMVADSGSTPPQKMLSDTSSFIGFLGVNYLTCRVARLHGALRKAHATAEAKKAKEIANIQETAQTLWQEIYDLKNVYDSSSLDQWAVPFAETDDVSPQMYNQLFVASLYNATVIYFNRVIAQHLHPALLGANPSSVQLPRFVTEPPRPIQEAAHRILYIARFLSVARPDTSQSVWPRPLFFAGLEIQDPVHVSWIISQLVSGVKWGSNIEKTARLLQFIKLKEAYERRQVDVREMMEQTTGLFVM